MLLSFQGLSWEDLKAQDEARDGGRNHRKGSFIHTSTAWSGKTGRLGLLMGVPTSNPSMGAAISGLLAFSHGSSRLRAQANRADTATCFLIWLRGQAVVVKVSPGPCRLKQRGQRPASQREECPVTLEKSIEDRRCAALRKRPPAMPAKGALVGRLGLEPLRACAPAAPHAHMPRKKHDFLLTALSKVCCATPVFIISTQLVAACFQGTTGTWHLCSARLSREGGDIQGKQLFEEMLSHEETGCTKALPCLSVARR